MAGNFDSSKHPRGNSKNKGEFGPGGGGASSGAKGGANGNAPQESKADRVARAKAAHVYVGKDIQRYAEEHNEPRVAKALGGVSFPDGEPIDIAVPGPSGKVAHGVELKTVVANSNGKITMKGEAIARKASWERKNKATCHTLVLDDSMVKDAYGPGKHDESKRVMYYANGYGSFRIQSMHKITGGMDEVKKLMNTPYKKLPPAAQKHR